MAGLNYNQKQVGFIVANADKGRNIGTMSILFN